MKIEKRKLKEVTVIVNTEPTSNFVSEFNSDAPRAFERREDEERFLFVTVYAIDQNKEQEMQYVYDRSDDDSDMDLNSELYNDFCCNTGSEKYFNYEDYMKIEKSVNKEIEKCLRR